MNKNINNINFSKIDTLRELKIKLLLNPLKYFKDKYLKLSVLLIIIMKDKLTYSLVIISLMKN